MNMPILILLLLAHIIGDFYFQTDNMCQEKKENHFKSKYLYGHSLLISALSWLLIGSLSFWPYFLILSVSHIIIDLIKSYYQDDIKSFTIDQIAHVFMILFISASYKGGGYADTLYDFTLAGYNLFWLCLAILLLLKPTNILAKLILEKYKIHATTQGTSKEVKDAGALIGNLERVLTLCFVLIGQYEAIGFVIAAKSLLRYKDGDTPKSEYVLAGTLLSFGIAIIIGLLLKYFAV